MISILEVENVDFREVDIVDITDSIENQESAPQIYFNGKSFGGYDELFEAYQNDERMTPQGERVYDKKTTQGRQRDNMTMTKGRHDDDKGTT